MASNKVAFFYCVGTSYVFRWLEIGFGIDSALNVYVGADYTTHNKNYATIAGLNGETVTWDGAPQNDPFPSMLDPNVFAAERVVYPASMFPMNYSVGTGISTVVAKINALPQGQPFALGGYSQGALVMSSVYNEIRYGSLTSRASSFLGGVMFGNPRRQLNHRGAVGGTWSGCWDIAGSSTGGHGSAPASGPYARLSACESKWVEFAHPGDIFACVGDSTTGVNWVAANDAVFTVNAADLIGIITGYAAGLRSAAEAGFALGGAVNHFTDAAGKAFDIGGLGHTAYAFIPPEGNPDSGLTSYQIALKYLNSLASGYATAPVTVPSSLAGWSTTLRPPLV